LDVPPETAQIRGNWAVPDGSLAIVIDTMGVELEPPDRLEIEQAWQRERSHFPQ
jgi:hypothetical protein